MGMKFQDSTTVTQATWNSSTTAGASGANVSAYEWGYCTVLVTLHYTGSVTGGALTFEGFDNYNWFSIIPNSQINSSTAPTTTTFTFSSAAGDTGFFCNSNCFSQFRTRLSTTITGTGTVLVNINSSAATSATV